MMNILVTGATGIQGTTVVDALSRQPEVQVYAGTRSPDAATLPKGVIARALDWQAPETVRAAMEDIDKLFLLTPLIENHVQSTMDTIDAARAAGVRHIVRLSASPVGNVPDIQISQWHRTVEEYLASAGVPFTVLRPGSFMENYFNAFMPNEDGILYQTLGDGAVACIDGRDTADVAVKVLCEDGHVGKTYTLTGPEAITSTQALAHIAAASGRSMKYVDLAPDAVEQAMRDAGLSSWLVGALMEVFAIMRDGNMSAVTDDVRAVTGHKPRSFATFAQDYAGKWTR